MNTPRPEHPRPQFLRYDWISLNGTWNYKQSSMEIASLDGPTGNASLDFNEVFYGRSEPSEIVVPFAPESPLSGIGDKDQIAAQRYTRTIDIPSEWKGKDVVLHFGAVYYYARVYIDGKLVRYHAGGSVSFEADITRFVNAGASHALVVDVTNNLWDGSQPSGKQSWKYQSWGCKYTRTTGIWQSVWLEAIDRRGLEGVHVIPDLDGGRFTFVPTFRAIEAGQRWRVRVAGAAAQTSSAADGIPVVVDVDEPHAWTPEDPYLYDVTFEVLDSDGVVIDSVESYAGLRKVHIEGNRFFLNNKPYFQRLVLDQGFYPDGIWTAPSDEALRQDIELSKNAGFNGARLHQKVFEERFLYWADKLGYLVWGESASWGLDYNREGLPPRNFLSEWREIVYRDRNHPAIVAWTPFNETRIFDRPATHKRLHEDAYHICKALDPTRPVNDASGYVHHITDLYTVHSYEQDPEKLREQMENQPDRGVFRNFEYDAPYENQPYYVDEFGGIKWAPETQQGERSGATGKPKGWGYGQAPTTLDEFYQRLEGQIDALHSIDHISGWCYTQLTDVEQEQNGIYFYDRSVKFDMDRIKSLFTKPKPGFEN